MGRLLVTTAVAVALAVPAATANAAPAAPANSSPGVWVQRLCGEVVSWEKQIVKGGQDLGKTLQGASPAKIKAKLVDYLSLAVRLSDTLIKRVDEVGTPAVKNGTKIRRAFHQALLKVKGLFAQARSDIAALPASDPQKLAKGAAAVGNRLQAAGTAIQSTFDAIAKRYPTADLDRAFNNVAACRAIRS